MRWNGLLCPKSIRKSTSARQKKKGAIGLTVVVFGAMFLIAGYFFMVVMPLKLIQMNKMTSTLDNATASAVTLIDEDLVRTQGKVEIRATEAEEAVYAIIAEAYDLTLIGHGVKFKPNQKSELAELPYVQVKVVNVNEAAGEVKVVTMTEADGTKDNVTVDASSVIVHVNIKFKPTILVFDKGMELSRTAVSEVRIGTTND